MISIQVTITLETGDTPDQVDEAFHQLGRLVAAAQPLPVTPLPPSPQPAAIREAILASPPDATGPELAQRIKDAGTAARKAGLDFSDHGPITTKAEPPSPKRRGHRPGWRITHEELAALDPIIQQRLTDVEREAVTLNATGLNNTEIATQLGRTPKSVYQSLRRARIKLALPAGAPTKRRGRPRRNVPPPIVHEGSVHCPLCDADRTALHVEQHHIENEREQARQAAGRASIAMLSKSSGVGGVT